MTTANHTVLYIVYFKVAKTVDLKSSHHKGKQCVTM